MTRGVRTVSCRYRQLRRMHYSLLKVLPDADVMPNFPGKRVRRCL